MIRESSFVEAPTEQRQLQPSHGDSAAALRPEARAAERRDRWRPYELAALETQLWSCLPDGFFRVRWSLLRWAARAAPGGLRLGQLLALLLAAALALGLAALLFFLPWSLLSTGRLASLLLVASLQVVLRNGPAALLFGLTHEHALPLHQLLFWLSLLAGLYHGLLAASLYSSAAVSGWYLLGALALAGLLSLRCLRRWMYGVFLATHYASFAVVLLLALIHRAYFLVFSLACFLADLVARKALSRTRTRRLQNFRLRALADTGLAAMSWDNRGLRFRPGQFLYVRIAEVSLAEAKPFFISSAPGQARLELLFRNSGQWTGAVKDAAQLGRAVTAELEGPFGSVPFDVDNKRYKVFLFIAGGVGVGYNKGMCAHLLAQHARGRPMAKIYFLWSVRVFRAAREVLAGPDEVFLAGRGRDESADSADEPILLTRVFVTGTAVPADAGGEFVAGRMNVFDVLREARAEALRMRQVEVPLVCCAPPAFRREVAAAARDFSDRAFDFLFYGPSFYF